MRDVYACRLPLVEDGPPAFQHALGAVRGHVRHELDLDEMALAGDEGSLAPAPGVALRWRLLTAPGVEDHLWTMRSQRPHDHDAELAWNLNVDVALEDGRAWVGMRLALSPTGRRLAPIPFEIRPPDLVGAVVDAMEVAEDGWRLTREPAYAVDDGGVRALADLLLDPDRVLPVVVVTPVEVYDDDQDRFLNQPVVDPDDIADSLVGLAHVAVVDSPALTYGLTEMVGREMSVFGGAVRLYWPDIEGNERPAMHPLWLPDRLAEPRNQPLSSVLLRRIAATATFRVSAATLDAWLRSAMERHRRSEIAGLFERAKEASLAPEWQGELERAWSEVDRLREDYAEVAQQLEVAHDNLRAMSRHLPAAVAEALVEDVAATSAPTSVAEAVERAQAECEHLVFLDDAVESARRAAYRQPARVYAALSAMDEVAAEWRAGHIPTGFRDAFAERGFSFSANVSPTALGKHGHEYERTYDGRTIALGPHLGLGRGSPVACCRIYFHIDEQSRLFVVGHVGSHLSDTTTG